MGEAKRKLTRNRLHLTKHPLCVYCGGNAQGTQVDHAPPIAIFSLKKRPQGLEFSACADCHEGTRKLDLVAAVMSRIYPDFGGELEREEIGKLITGLARNVPTMGAELSRMIGTGSDFEASLSAKLQRPVHALRIGPPLHAALEAFTARMGLALHYELTGRILPESGAVAVRVFFNAEAISDGLPEEVLALIKSPRALRQKGLMAHKEFQWDWAFDSEDNASVSFCTFRQSFATLAICAENEDFMGDEIADQLFRPGFLSGLPL
jgi:hypothetical protein